MIAGSYSDAGERFLESRLDALSGVYILKRAVHRFWDKIFIGLWCHDSQGRVFNGPRLMPESSCNLVRHCNMSLMLKISVSITSLLLSRCDWWGFVSATCLAEFCCLLAACKFCIKDCSLVFSELPSIPSTFLAIISWWVSASGMFKQWVAHVVKSSHGSDSGASTAAITDADWNTSAIVVFANARVCCMLGRNVKNSSDCTSSLLCLCLIFAAESLILMSQPLTYAYT